MAEFERGQGVNLAKCGRYDTGQKVAPQPKTHQAGTAVAPGTGNRARECIVVQLKQSQARWQSWGESSGQHIVAQL